MSYILNNITIRPPTSFHEANKTQSAQQQALNGAIGRDYFGSNKRQWSLGYKNVNPTDYIAIYNIYITYQGSAIAVPWQVSEGNYTITPTTVHVDLLDRGFSVPGSNYISDFTLILTEA